MKQLGDYSKPGNTTVCMILLPKWKSNLLPTLPVLVQATNSHRWSQGVVKSKAETPQSYVVQTPHGGYNRNRLQLKEAAIPTTYPVSISTTKSTISRTVQPVSVSLYKRRCLLSLYVISRNYTIKVISLSQLNVPLTTKCESGGRSWNQGKKEFIQAQPMLHKCYNY